MELPIDQAIDQSTVMAPASVRTSLLRMSTCRQASATKNNNARHVAAASASSAASHTMAMAPPLKLPVWLLVTLVKLVDTFDTSVPRNCTLTAPPSPVVLVLCENDVSENAIEESTTSARKSTSTLPPPK